MSAARALCELARRAVEESLADAPDIFEYLERMRAREIEVEVDLACLNTHALSIRGVRMAPSLVHPLADIRSVSTLHTAAGAFAKLDAALEARAAMTRLTADIIALNGRAKSLTSERTRREQAINKRLARVFSEAANAIGSATAYMRCCPAGTLAELHAHLLACYTMRPDPGPRPWWQWSVRTHQAHDELHRYVSLRDDVCEVIRLKDAEPAALRRIAGEVEQLQAEYKELQPVAEGRYAAHGEAASYKLPPEGYVILRGLYPAAVQRIKTDNALGTGPDGSRAGAFSLPLADSRTSVTRSTR